MAAEPTALRTIYDEHVGFVWRSLRRLGVRESDLPDATQDVFLVVHRKLEGFEARSKMTTWLFGIAMRVARDRARLAHERRRVDDVGAIDACVDPRPDAASVFERRQAAAMLEDLLAQMPVEQRAVFCLFELEGQRGEDIALALEIPLGTVYSRLRLAREFFQRKVARLRAEQQSATGAPAPRVSEVRVVVHAADERAVSFEGARSEARLSEGGRS